MSYRFDGRTIAQVQSNVCACNLKPFRNKEQRESARFYADKGKDGAWHSQAIAQSKSCTCGARNAKVRLENIRHK